MKKILLLAIVLLAIGYFFYSKNDIPWINNNIKNNPIFSSAKVMEEVSYRVEDNRIFLSTKDTQVVLTKTEPFNTNGYVMGANHSMDGPFSVFSGTYGIVWGDTAIELASAPSEKMKDPSYFSSEARKVIQEQGCAAGYLNNHLISLLAIAESAAINKTLMDIKEKDIVDIKGYKVNVESATFKGESFNNNFPNVVYITEVSIKDKPAEK